MDVEELDGGQCQRGRAEEVSSDEVSGTLEPLCKCVGRAESAVRTTEKANRKTGIRLFDKIRGKSDAIKTDGNLYDLGLLA